MVPENANQMVDLLLRYDAVVACGSTGRSCKCYASVAGAAVTDGLAQEHVNIFKDLTFRYTLCWLFTRPIKSQGMTRPCSKKMHRSLS